MISIFGLLICIIAFIISFIISSLGFVWYPVVLWLRWTGLIFAFIALIYLFINYKHEIKEFYDYLHKFFGHLVPWLVISGLVLSIIILYIVWPKKKITHICFDNLNGAIFNSWEHNPQHTRHIKAWGLKPGDPGWVIDKDCTAHFSYEIDSNVSPNDNKESSGGYMTFYDNYCDRLTYSKISFECRATEIDPNGNPDIGIRLAVDDPKATEDKECVTYEIPSLKIYYNGERYVSSSWQEFSIRISDFELKRSEPPFPQWIDKNTINKIVFFVNNDIVKRCKKGKLWFSEIKFEN